ncbi:hypothetical protein CPT_Merlin294 [Citrobacter phage Merlin]|uniref:Uncharacterized protein n=1 Tax=Citrobacter phage Merlin TaxID=1675602 RepID=A0A0K1LP77_9CAUD|nr:hypothetical protein CPT_Merlin294 [Citrobacter phage Merlin]AKU43940.1 hypothetical protein CPT_Merlin294 [Citrobacter phage Merlin]
MKVTLKIEVTKMKAKDALTSNKLIVDNVEYDICGVREVEPGTLTFFTMIFSPKAETVFKQFVFNPEDEVTVKNANFK